MSSRRCTRSSSAVAPRPAALALAALLLLVLPSRGVAASAVFAGDPVDPGSGTPYEILPGKPLVRPGADALLGTADDIVDAGLVGDVDLVVRAGDSATAGPIPPPALATGDVPAAVAGPRGAGGSEIPFTVFVSDGAAAPGQPAGRVLPAADLDGLPVVVVAFADYDGDGFIGLTSRDRDGTADAHLELRELEPVGRSAALLSGGVAHGTLAVRAGLPASAGGLGVALAAVAGTGSLDAAFFDGAVPTGPAISTALPFLPLRDLNRIIRDRPVPAGPTTTLQQLVQFAAVPPADTYALPLDGSEPTIDGARVTSQAAVRVSFRAGNGDSSGAAVLDQVAFGRDGAAATLRVRLLAVDRFENPADPPPGYAVVIDSDASLEILGQRGARRGRPVSLRRASGRLLLGRVARGTPDGSRGTLRIERDGVVIASLPYAVDAAIRQRRPDVTVPSRTAPTIGAAIAAATDVNRDGVVAIAVRPGLYREAVVVDRAIELTGSGGDLSLIEGVGTGTGVDITAAGAVVQGLGAVGAGTGFRLAGSGAALRASSAWRSVGAGVEMTASHGVVRDLVARENGSAGVRIDAAATAATCAGASLRANFGPGLSIAAAADVQLDGNVATQNNAGGLALNGATAAAARGNRLVANVGSGVAAVRAGAITVTDNLVALNDEDGMQFDRCDDVLVSGNTILDNNGTGLFFRRGNNGDFAVAAGVQPPPGDNRISGNRKGDVEVRTD